jgi:hypothetical protein
MYYWSYNDLMRISSLMKAFDAWLIKHRYLQSGETVFVESIPDNVPEWIAMWILDE